MNLYGGSFVLVKFLIVIFGYIQFAVLKKNCSTTKSTYLVMLSSA